MYSQSVQTAERGKRITGAVRRRRSAGRGERGREDKVRLLQLFVCFLLFLTVFIGKGVFPQKLVEVRTEILDLIGSNTDFRSAFSDLGASLTGEDSVLNELGEFCVAVFSGTGDRQAAAIPPDLSAQTDQELGFLSGGTGQSIQAAAHYLRLEQMPADWLPVAPAPAPAPEPEPLPAEEPVVIAAVGTVIKKSDYNGMALPAKHTMDVLSLGALETVAPLTGSLHSGYGYRDHPVDGAYKFHSGLDIGGQVGDTIAAFAAGTVEYIGKNDAYGLYMQLDHGNGVKTFYAHCSKLCCAKGDTVALGEKIAEVGSTGTATGPHLHFEIKCGGLRVDPAFYLGA